jgi:hypothetical protein
MERYLTMLKNVGSVLDGVLPQKLTTFCDRMLGPTKPDDERNTVIAFLRDAGLSLNDGSLAVRVLELVKQEDTLAETARNAIAEHKIPPNEGENDLQQ